MAISFVRNIGLLLSGKLLKSRKIVFEFPIPPSGILLTEEYYMMSAGIDPSSLRIRKRTLRIEFKEELFGNGDFYLLTGFFNGGKGGSSRIERNYSEFSIAAFPLNWIKPKEKNIEIGIKAQSGKMRVSACTLTLRVRK